MRLIQVQLDSKTPSSDTFKFEAGLNVIRLGDEHQVKSCVESLCSGVLLVPVRAPLNLDLLRVEFETENGQQFRFDSALDEESLLFRKDLTSDVRHRIGLEEYRRDCLQVLSPQSFTRLAGLTFDNKTELVTEKNSDGDELKGELKELELEQLELKRLVKKVSDLQGQLKILNSDLALDDKIATLDSESLQKLESAPKAQERYNSQKSLIRTARMKELNESPDEPSLFEQRNFWIGSTGVLASFAIAYVSGIPLLALANLFFAALLVQTLLRKIDAREVVVRNNARRKAVDGAEVRNQRARTISNANLEKIAESVDCDLETLKETARTLDSRKKARKELEEMIRITSGGREYSALKAELSSLSGRIAKIHREILEKNLIPTQGEHGAESEDSEQEKQWDRMFFGLLKGDLGATFSPTQIENLALEHLQRLSEGRFDGITIAEDGALTVVGPDDVFPVSFLKLNKKDQTLVSHAVRFGVVSRLISDKIHMPIVLQDTFTEASSGRRLRFRDAVEALAQSSQIIVVSAAPDWDSLWVRNS